MQAKGAPSQDGEGVLNGANDEERHGGAEEDLGIAGREDGIVEG